MTYYTVLEIVPFHEQKLDLQRWADSLLAQLEQDGMEQPFFTELQQAFLHGRARLAAHGVYVAHFLERLHLLAPELSFGARGWGDDFHDVWIREFQHGKEAFALGPFAESAPTTTLPPWLTAPVSPTDTDTPRPRPKKRMRFGWYLLTALTAAAIWYWRSL